MDRLIFDEKKTSRQFYTYTLKVDHPRTGKGTRGRVVTRPLLRSEPHLVFHTPLTQDRREVTVHVTKGSRRGCVGRVWQGCRKDVMLVYLKKIFIFLRHKQRKRIRSIKRSGRSFSTINKTQRAWRGCSTPQSTRVCHTYLKVLIFLSLTCQTTHFNK